MYNNDIITLIILNILDAFKDNWEFVNQKFNRLLIVKALKKNPGTKIKNTKLSNTFANANSGKNNPIINNLFFIFLLKKYQCIIVFVPHFSIKFLHPLL